MNINMSMKTKIKMNIVTNTDTVTDVDRKRLQHEQRKKHGDCIGHKELRAASLPRRAEEMKK
jgi:hypothetical protein